MRGQVPDAPAETSVVEHEVRVAAPPDAVFEYFTDPVKLVSWMGSEATLDPRPGGVCRIDINGFIVSGKFVQVDPPWRIVLSWGWEMNLFAVPPESTAVEVSFTPDGDDTIVRLSHCRLPAGSEVFHRTGWSHYLPRLAIVAAGGDPGPDPFADPTVVIEALRGASTE
jgi:uncharacterized protein YndB with AHSA1/START domain